MPESPGVYYFTDQRGRVIYVGKAKRLRSRVRNYLQPRDRLDAKTNALVAAASSIDYIVAGNEVEALVLECSMIKEYRPRYNIRLKDDKRYPYLKLTLNELFPRLLLVREVLDDGAEYFGPYTDSGAVRRTLRLIQRIFPLRSCTGRIDGTSERECLNFQIGRCCGPCSGRAAPDAYREIVMQVRLFLRGRNEALARELETRMREFSRSRCYEAASTVRDQIEALTRIRSRQYAVDQKGGDADALAVAREGVRACGVVVRVREGKILSSEAFYVPIFATDDITSIYAAFLKHYYHSATDIPERILLQRDIPERSLLSAWLGGRAGGAVAVTLPSRGHRRRLVELAELNATARLVASSASVSRAATLLAQVKRTLALPSTPRRVEAFDISNLGGRDAVGSMVTFENGKPFKSGYRHFRIRDPHATDDLAMMHEVISRRFERLRSGRERRPDLVLVDGGAGQVSAALRAMETVAASVPVVGLAKRNEEIHLPGEVIVRLARRSPVLRFLQRIRDEAHRFAVEYQRKIRGRTALDSRLDGIPGVGQKRRLWLLVTFGSVEGIAAATREQIAAVPGIGAATAERVHEHLHG